MNETPEELKKWNWGAFSLNIIWGIGNRTYLPLLCLIPFFNLIWIFICGAKGNQWAWQDGDYKDVETFKKVQATWECNAKGSRRRPQTFVCFHCPLVASADAKPLCNVQQKSAVGFDPKFK